MPDLSTRRWPRRTVLALAAGSAGLLLTRTPARGAEVTVGGFSFTVPDSVRPVPPASAYGLGWQWYGRGTPAGPDDRLATVVLARADLASTDPQEVTGLLFANSVAGFLPDLELGGSRPRSMPGGGDQTRLDVRYRAARSVPFHGTMLVATRPEPPAAVLVVLGGGDLTAGTVAAVLDSARWLS